MSKIKIRRGTTKKPLERIGIKKWLCARGDIYVHQVLGVVTLLVTGGGYATILCHRLHGEQKKVVLKVFAQGISSQIRVGRRHIKKRGDKQDKRVRKVLKLKSGGRLVITVVRQVYTNQKTS